MRVFNLREKDIDKVIELGDFVYGDGYLSREYYLGSLERSVKNGVSCSFVGYDDLTEDLIAFRITDSPGSWEFDEWCSPDLWEAPPEKVCYFKVNTVHPDHQGQGIGSMMIAQAINAVKLQGGVAGAAHIWMESPGGAAYKCFAKAGGKVIKTHRDKWINAYRDYGTICVIDGQDCHCTAAEMLIHFDEGERNV